MWIVKLGGSLASSANLRPWLAQLVSSTGRRRVVVPGGGAFAQTVREQEAVIGYGATAAHRMAILGMQQMATALLSLEPQLSYVETVAEIDTLSGAAIWFPWTMAGMEAAIEPSWDVTSDSLAVWLATRIGAEDVVLVKSAQIEAGEASASDLVAEGLVDAAFPTYAAAYPGRVRLLPASWRGRLADTMPGARLVVP